MTKRSMNLIVLAKINNDILRHMIVKEKTNRNFSKGALRHALTVLH